MTKEIAQREHIAHLLQQVFLQKYVDAALRHYTDSVKRFGHSEWEPCLLKASKFIEAVIKALADYAKLALPNPRQFKVSAFIDKLAQLDHKKYDDTIRLLIPRICRFAYDIASNRGARHDPAEIDPNKMDAVVVVGSISWILAEMVRFAQKGSLKPDEAMRVVDSLMDRKYPYFEDIDGRSYVNLDGLSARDTALLLMDYRYPKRFYRDDLLIALERHGFKKQNSAMAVSRIQKFVDDDGKGNLLLRGNGRNEADRILVTATTI